MKSTIAEEKAAVRRRVRALLTTLSEEERQQSDDALFLRFLALPQVKQTDTIFAFWGVPGREPDTARLASALVRIGKRVALPRMLPGEGEMEPRLYCPQRAMVPAGFGISEPGTDCPLLSPEEIGLILVPNLCCDRSGYRLGFGGGYYDRWLSRHSAFTVALCREAVLQDTLPRERHDLPVDLVLTEHSRFP